MNTGEFEIHLPAKSKHRQPATGDKHPKAEESQRLMILPTALRSHTLFTYMKNAGEDISHVKIFSESVIVETNLDPLDTWKTGKIISVRFHSDQLVKPWGGVFGFSVEYRDSHGEAVIKKYRLQSGILVEE